MSAAEAGGFFSSSITFFMQFCRCSLIASLQLDFASFKIISIFSLIEAASGSLFDRVGRGIVYSSRSKCFEYQVYQSLATLASSIALATTYSVDELPASIYSGIDLRLVMYVVRCWSSATWSPTTSVEERLLAIRRLVHCCSDSFIVPKGNEAECL